MNSFESLSSPERVEAKVMAYDDYERLCAVANDDIYRKSGILCPDNYLEIIADDETVFIDAGGVDVPLTANIRLGASQGYDADRAVSLAKSSYEESSFMTLPIANLSDSVRQKATSRILDKGGVLFFADYEDREEKNLLLEAKKSGCQIEKIPLVDSSQYCKGREDVSISLFLLDVDNKNYIPNQKCELSDIATFFDDNIKPDMVDRDNCTLLVSGNKLSADQLKEMWQLYRDRFQFLGEEHPISMEDSEPEFIELITSNNTLASIKYQEGKIVCFTDLTTDIDKIFWLNKEYVDKLSVNNTPSELTLFFPGIVSSKIGGSGDVLRLFVDVAAEVGIKARVLFENTNRSERYIPPIIKRNIASSKKAFIVNNEIIKLNEVKYKAIRINSKDGLE